MVDFGNVYYDLFSTSILQDISLTWTKERCLLVLRRFPSKG